MNVNLFNHPTTTPMKLPGPKIYALGQLAAGKEFAQITYFCLHNTTATPPLLLIIYNKMALM